MQLSDRLPGAKGLWQSTCGTDDYPKYDIMQNMSNCREEFTDEHRNFFWCTPEESKRGALFVSMAAPARLLSPLLLAASVALHADAAVDIFFMRHGETMWNRAKVLQGSIPYTDLTWKGVRMAEATAKGFVASGIRFDRIYTSPYQRARHTAQLVSDGGAGPEPVVDARLREMNFGRYEGARYEVKRVPFG